MAGDQPPLPGLFDEPERVVLSVSELAGSLRRTLEGRFGRVTVRGEISGLKKPSSGHLYFVLKDARAQIRAVHFRSDALGLRFLPGDGVEVEAEGEVSLYEPRGELQLIVRRMSPSGLGALMQAFEALKQRLAAEGLFDAARKRPLPAFPRSIGIVTSPSGAAVRDLLQVLSRRWPPARKILVPVRVQGDGASQEIVAALHRLQRFGEVDVIVVGRGGGSLEDLWAFNEEGVARAIATCRIPVISAVGHETDVTIADFAADVRAPTPSAAAEIAVPDWRDVAERFREAGSRLSRLARDGVARRRRELDRLVAAYGFRRPERFLRREQQRVDDAASRLGRSMAESVRGNRETARILEHRLAAAHPRGRVAAAQGALAAVRSRLARSLEASAAHRRARVAGVERALRALDPSAVLGRGYCLARSEDGRVVARADGLEAGASLVVQFRRDRARVAVRGVEEGGPVELEPRSGEGT